MAQLIEAYRRVKKIPKALILMGPTGAGKTSLAHLFNDRELISKKINKYGQISLDTYQKEEAMIG